MFLEIVFAIYALLLITLTIVVGFNFVRIGTQLELNPKIITVLLPLLINFVLANTVFRSISPFFSTLLPCLLCYFISRKLQNVRIFGLTGGIATGKTTLVRQIQKHLKHVSIIDCDQISRSLSNKDQPGYRLILHLLGDKSNEYINSVTKQIQKQKFSNFVFQNKEFRNQLTKEMGKFIISKVFKTIVLNIVKGKNLMIVDAPILYETRILEYICFPIIVVGCSKQLQIQRLSKRSNLTGKQVEKRIQSQMPLQQKKRKCQIYLDNCKSQESLLNDFLTKIKPYMQKNFSKASKKYHK